MDEVEHCEAFIPFLHGEICWTIHQQQSDSRAFIDFVFKFLVENWNGTSSFFIHTAIKCRSKAVVKKPGQIENISFSFKLFLDLET